MGSGGVGELGGFGPFATFTAGADGGARRRFLIHVTALEFHRRGERIPPRLKCNCGRGRRPSVRKTLRDRSRAHGGASRASRSRLAKDVGRSGGISGTVSRPTALGTSVADTGYLLLLYISFFKRHYFQTQQASICVGTPRTSPAASGPKLLRLG